MTTITLALTTGRLLKVVRGDKFEVTMTGTPKEQESLVISENSVIQKDNPENSGGNVSGGTINIFGALLAGLRFSLPAPSTLDVVVSIPPECNVTVSISGLYQTVDIEDADIQHLDVTVNGSTHIAAAQAHSFCGCVNGSGAIVLKKITGGVRTDIIINGSGNITTTGCSGNIAASVSGSGVIMMNDVNQGNMAANIAGSGLIQVKGLLYQLVCGISGSGRFDLTTTERPHKVSKSVSGSGGLSINLIT